MTSVYRWQGSVEEATERQLVLKTASGRVEALRARLLDLHPYDVPEFLVVAASAGSDSYLSWLREAVEVVG
jgi:periplasmic divalent cation tolerance protein